MEALSLLGSSAFPTGLCLLDLVADLELNLLNSLIYALEEFLFLGFSNSASFNIARVQAASRLGIDVR